MVDVATRLDPTTWAGIGLLGLLLFGIGVGLPYIPSLQHVPSRPLVAILLAVLGGVIAAIGLGYAYDLRPGGPGRPQPPPGGLPPERASVRSVPSFEIYDPGDPGGSGRRKP
jgi:hypothetical protein